MVQMMSVAQQEHDMKVRHCSRQVVTRHARQEIRFQEGLLGFPDIKKFTLVNLDTAAPFKLLTADDCSGPEFVVLDPLEFCPNYRITLSGTELCDLELESPDDADVYVLVVIPEDPGQMTANLRGPIVINKKKGLGKQVILLSNDYSTSHHILQEIKEQR